MTRMTPHRLYNWGSAILLLCTLLALFWPVGNPHAASQAAAIKEQGDAFRFAVAAREICGEDAAWTLNGQTITCLKELK